MSGRPWVVCCARMADDEPKTKTHNTANEARSISRSPFCSINSIILYLELIVRVCTDSSASLIVRVERPFGIVTELYNIRSPSACWAVYNALERTLLAAVRERHESNFDNSSTSIVWCVVLPLDSATIWPRLCSSVSTEPRRMEIWFRRRIVWLRLLNEGDVVRHWHSNEDSVRNRASR